MMNATDDEMQRMAALRAGDEHVFREIHREFYHVLLYFAKSLVENTQDAEDIVADSFLKLWVARRRSQSLQGIKGFLYLTIKNACLNLLRQRKHRSLAQQRLLAFETNIEDSVLVRMVKAEIHQEILRELEKLPRNTKAVMKDLFLEEKEPGRIAVRHGLARGSVYWNKSYGLSLLRRYINKEDLLPSTVIALLAAVYLAVRHSAG